MHARVVRAADRHPVPWRNGAGSTEEIAAGPGWRLSLAALGTAPSEFSSFPGIDRVFTVVGGHGVTLDSAHRTRQVDPWQPHGFPGEDAPRCVPDGYTHAFNVMTERGTAAATVTAVVLDGPVTTDAGEITALFVRSGTTHTDTEPAAAGDCVVVRNAAIDLRCVAVEGLLVRIRPA